ncbi:MAG: ABC transporter permease [Ruminococcaceae bacterium]|nr:ABC transporter permease [Oscillospiraceae bacterium]
MKKYFVLQLKRLLRLLPPVLIVAAVLFGCLMVALDAITDLSKPEGDTAKFKLGLVGTVDDLYLQLGLKAMQSLDSTRYSIEMVEMTEADAETAIRSGEIAAFVAFPENFLENALHGNILPLKFVCTTGAIGIVSLVKEEFTQVAQDMLLAAQKGIYGSGNAMLENGMSGAQVVGDISLEYAEFIFRRGNMYRTSELKAFDGLGMDGYMGGALSITLFMMLCLTFAPAMIRKDHSLTRMLCAGRRGILGQVLCDFGVYLLGLLCVAAVLLLYLAFWQGASLTPLLILQGLPALLALGALSFLMYELSSDLVSGILLQFFSMLALCFLCGCMYPITFFPESVQTVSAYLPMGLARLQLTDCALGVFSLPTTAGLIIYALVFLAAALSVRHLKATKIRG